MGLQKYATCTKCGRELKLNRENFKRFKNKETGKEEYHTICKECEKELEYNKHWDGNKLKCLVCGKSLDPSEFDSHAAYAIRGHKDGRCKECKRKQNLEARQNYNDNTRLYKTLQARFLNAKDRALRKGIPCTITKEFLLDLWNKQHGLCAISKIPMTYEMDAGRVYTNVSIDQINQGQGYTEDNVQLVCMAVNQLKSDWDMNTVKYICKMIVENYD